MLLPTLCFIAALASLLEVGVAATNPDARPIGQHSARQVIDQLRLVPNVEKGYYVQTFEDPDKVGGGNRSVSTLIYYLLEGAEGYSEWHRVDAAEVWHHYAGAPLTLSLSRDDGAPVAEHVLGPDIFHQQTPHVVVPRNVWQRARSAGSWTLVGTTVAPGFTKSGFELAPPVWKPKGSY